MTSSRLLKTDRFYLDMVVGYYEPVVIINFMNALFQEMRYENDSIIQVK